MLKVAYIATELPVPKQKKLSRKQLITQMAAVVLANRKHHDKIKALALFAPEEAANEVLRKKLDQILTEKNLKK